MAILGARREAGEEGRGGGDQWRGCNAAHQRRTGRWIRWGPRRCPQTWTSCGPPRPAPAESMLLNHPRVSPHKAASTAPPRTLKETTQLAVCSATHIETGAKSSWQRFRLNEIISFPAPFVFCPQIAVVMLLTGPGSTVPLGAVPQARHSTMRYTQRHHDDDDGQRKSGNCRPGTSMHRQHGATAPVTLWPN